MQSYWKYINERGGKKNCDQTRVEYTLLAQFLENFSEKNKLGLSVSTYEIKNRYYIKVVDPMSKETLLDYGYKRKDVLFRTLCNNFFKIRNKFPQANNYE